MAVGSALSYIWAVNVEKLKMTPSDGPDFQHAIAAAGASADFFVTHDAELAELIKRVPIKGISVATLGQLLEKVGDPDQRTCGSMS